VYQRLYTVLHVETCSNHRMCIAEDALLHSDEWGGGQYFGPFGFIRHHLYGNSLSQGFQNWGTCTPRGTFAYLKGYT